MAIGDSMTFLINDASTGGGNPQVRITVTENAGGTVTISVEQIGGAGAYLGDLRGLFFDLGDESLIGSLSTAANPLVTELQQKDDGVKDLGNGANMNGLLGGDSGYDVGVEFGTSGVGTGGDDIRNISFTLDSSVRDLTLADFANVTFGVRITAVGQDVNGDGTIDTARTGSSKIGETSFTPVDAKNDEAACAVENGNTVTGNVLANDGGQGTKTVTEVSFNGGAAVAVSATGTTFQLGNGATVTIKPDGSYTVDATTADALYHNQEIEFTLDYTVVQTGPEAGDSATSHATLTGCVTGINDQPDAKDDDRGCFLESTSPIVGNVLANDTDVDNGDQAKLIVTSINVEGTDYAVDADGETIELASGATLFIKSDGSYTFTTNGAYDGMNAGDPDVDLSFVYTVNDQSGAGNATDTAKLEICIEGEGNPPPPPVEHFPDNGHGLSYATFYFGTTNGDVRGVLNGEPAKGVNTPDGVYTVKINFPGGAGNDLDEFYDEILAYIIAHDPHVDANTPVLGVSIHAGEGDPRVFETFYEIDNNENDVDLVPSPPGDLAIGNEVDTTISFDDVFPTV